MALPSEMGTTVLCGFLMLGMHKGYQSPRAREWKFIFQI